MPIPPLTRMKAAAYRAQLEEDKARLLRLLNNVAEGRVAPAVDDIVIGSGRKVSAAVIFFDIRGFTQLTSSEDPATLKTTLFILNNVIPAMMRVLHRHGAYVEKNTGDGLMAIIGVETTNEETAANALSAAEEMLYVLHSIVNPILEAQGIAAVNARIGMDMGQMLLARIGLPQGSAKHSRSSLTAVGPAANRASKIQGLAGTNEIWCGDSIRNGAGADRLALFDDVTPADWAWQYGNNPNARYRVWRYRGRQIDLYATLVTGLLGR